MTETSNPASLTVPAAGRDLPPNVLLNLVVAILAPMFLGATGGDIYFARLAAIETVNAYQARSHADLIAIAQIIACGLAALGSLSLSMGDEISIHMALRLRGSANALNRSAEQHRRTLLQTPSPAVMSHDTAAEACRAQYEAEALASLATSTPRRERAPWMPSPLPRHPHQTPRSRHRPSRHRPPPLVPS